MKTPRDILLARHRAAEPALDAVRERALASMALPAAQPVSVSPALVFWRELILPCRRIWAGLSVVWLVIAALHISAGTDPAMSASRNTPIDRDALMALREQRQILAQLLDPAAPPPAAHPATPGPRGDVRRPIAAA